jgi:hypothetical protein
MVAATNLLSSFVFLLFLLRHTFSVALGLFPGENWLWRLSLAFGFDLLPTLAVLRDQAGCGTAGTFIFLAALVIASHSTIFFVSLLTLHVAAFAVWFCWMVSMVRYGSAFELSFTVPQLAQFVAMPNPLAMLSLCLLLACAHSHTRYIGILRGN